MSLATSLQGVVWLWLWLWLWLVDSPFSASPGSIRAGLARLAWSALLHVPDRSLLPGGLPVRGFVLQCLSNSRRSVEPAAALFTRKHVVRTLREEKTSTLRAITIRFQEFTNLSKHLCVIWRLCRLERDLLRSATRRLLRGAQRSVLSLWPCQRTGCVVHTAIVIRYCRHKQF